MTFVGIDDIFLIICFSLLDEGQMSVNPALTGSHPTTIDWSVNIPQIISSIIVV